MHFFIINKKQILIFVILFILVLFSSFYYINAHFNANSFCYEESTFCVSSLSDFDINSSEEIQSKIDSIYSSNEKIAYLTFDDGPTKIATTKILDILKEEDVNASFFVIGYRVEEFPDIVKRAYNEGHFIANHTYSHNNTKIYKSKTSFIEEIENTNKAISNAIEIPDYKSHIFRFPNGSKSNSYSSFKKNCIQYLHEINYAYIDWNALNNDSIGKYNSNELLNN